MTTQRSHALPSISTNGLHLLQETLKGSYDAVIVSIDFEHTTNLLNGFQNSQNSQAGLAILDTRDLRSIKTYNLITGSLRYTTNAANKFLFGQSVSIQPGLLLDRIMSVMPKERNTILLGHGVAVELRILNALGFEFAGILAVLDTEKLANEVLESGSLSLRKVLESLECPFSKLHCGGNDAHFTLWAALMLAAQGSQDKTISNILEPLLTRSIPYRVDPNVQAARKKEKRRQKSRKFQSKSWTAEEQDQIRAERAARRAETPVL